MKTWEKKYAESKTPRSSTYTVDGPTRLEQCRKDYADALKTHNDDSIHSHNTMLALAIEGRKQGSAMVMFKNNKPQNKAYLPDFNYFVGREAHHKQRIDEIDQLNNARAKELEENPIVVETPAEEDSSSAPPIINWRY
jgi:hypothetical protein